MSRLRFAALLAFSTACSPLTIGTEVKGEAVLLGNPMQAALNVFPAIGGMNDLDFNNSREFMAASITRDNVSSATVESVSVRIVSPTEQDFTFLDTLQFVARAGDKEEIFAERFAVKDLELPPPSPTLAMDVKLVDLGAFVGAPIMSIVMRGKGRQPANDTRLEVKVKLRVSASAKR